MKQGLKLNHHSFANLYKMYIVELKCLLMSDSSHVQRHWGSDSTKSSAECQMDSRRHQMWCTFNCSYEVQTTSNVLHLCSNAGMPSVAGSIYVLGKTSVEKKTFSFGHCPNHLNPPPDPNSGNLVLFFGRQNSRFESPLFKGRLTKKGLQKCGEGREVY